MSRMVSGGGASGIGIADASGGCAGLGRTVPGTAISASSPWAELAIGTIGVTDGLHRGKQGFSSSVTSGSNLKGLDFERENVPATIAFFPGLPRYWAVVMPVATSVSELFLRNQGQSGGDIRDEDSGLRSSRGYKRRPAKKRSNAVNKASQAEEFLVAVCKPPSKQTIDEEVRIEILMVVGQCRNQSNSHGTLIFSSSLPSSLATSLAVFVPTAPASIVHSLELTIGRNLAVPSKNGFGRTGHWEKHGSWSSVICDEGIRRGHRSPRSVPVMVKNREEGVETRLVLDSQGAQGGTGDLPSNGLANPWRAAVANCANSADPISFPSGDANDERLPPVKNLDSMGRISLGGRSTINEDSGPEKNPGTEKWGNGPKRKKNRDQKKETKGWWANY
ncbi:hypothetical protein M413DRAFT_428187 [Hebeloma cylindrosporum]|uniref:Uncharacterized protein n=1 Tax=Hebeloma cylindrosporum TaxID=76867 RepID=A0A0C3BGV8_HEBCY|nr:hypothetical protein M413DRAFT_428187 [Hebeloma cylindrosporum h7]